MCYDIYKKFRCGKLSGHITREGKHYKERHTPALSQDSIPNRAAFLSCLNFYGLCTPQWNLDKFKNLSRKKYWFYLFCMDNIVRCWSTLLTLAGSIAKTVIHFEKFIM